MSLVPRAPGIIRLSFNGELDCLYIYLLDVCHISSQMKFGPDFSQPMILVIIIVSVLMGYNNLMNQSKNQKVAKRRFCANPRRWKLQGEST